MNQCFPDWNFDDDLLLSSHKKPMGRENELVELLWRDGQVVLNSQTQRKPDLNSNEPRQQQVHKHGLKGSEYYGNSSNVIQQQQQQHQQQHQEETVSWMHYPLEDSFEKELCSNFFSGLQSSEHMDATDDTHAIRQFRPEKSARFDFSNSTPVVVNPQQHEFNESPIPPMTYGIIGHHKNIKGSGKVIDSSEFTTMTVGSTNQVHRHIEMSRASSNCVGTTMISTGPLKDVVPVREKGKTDTFEPTLTSSSSGGSGSSFGRISKQSTGVSCSHKRKSREDSEFQSEAAELDDKSIPRSGSSRRSRAAEVHNLSERKRRDRINEKMKALQELIPHCKKTDKASMLDEAIEYLKSLQLQLQVMWMGSRMTPVLFPGMQPYMSRMTMGMAPAQLRSMHNLMHFNAVPLVDQSMAMAPTQNQAAMCQPQVFDYQNQMQNSAMADQFARYMGYQQMQTASQPLNMPKFGSTVVQQNQASAPPISSSGTFLGGVATDNVPLGR